MLANPTMLLLLLGALSIVVLVTLGAFLMMRPTLYQDRLGYKVKEVETLREKELRSPFKARVVTPFIEAFSKALTRRTQSAGSAATARKLQLAGLNWVPAQFNILQFAGILAGLGLGVGAAFVLKPTGLTPLLLVLVGLVVGVLGPRLWLSRKVTARKLLILNLLPTGIDNLAGCIFAGLTFQAAIVKLATIMDNPLGQEFANVWHKVQIGQPLTTALIEMGERTQVPEVQRFALAVIQAEEFGTPIGTILENQSADLRDARKQRAQQKAAKAPVKMLFPMVGCFFPTIFILLLGPAAIVAINTFGGK